MHEMPTEDSLDYVRELDIALPSDSLVQRLWRLRKRLPGRRLLGKLLSWAAAMPGRALAKLRKR